MSPLRFQCPGCHLIFPGKPGEALATFSCPGCHRNLAAEHSLWFAHRNEQVSGPYSWLQLQALAARQHFLADTVLTVTRSCPGPSIEDEPPVLLLNPALAGQATLEDMVEETALTELAVPPSRQQVDAGPPLTLSMGDFQILRKLGAGGMGAVYLAYQRSQQRKVALKTLSPALAGMSSYVQRFLREALMLGQLHHPNIVQFLGAGAEKGVPFLAMEYIEGFSSATLLKRLGHPLLVGDALHIILKCAQALEYAHTQGVVHRDIKPENILITSLGRVKIGDLGLAKPLSEDLSLTETGLMLGSPKFMAPEQARNAKHADYRSDIYALGGVLYFFLTGRAPFEGGTAMELLLAKERGMNRPVRHWNPDVPSRIGLMVDKMLMTDPRRRHQGCGELIREIETLQAANEYLSFNPLHIVPLAELRPEYLDRSVVEILLVEDRNADILLTQQALEEKDIPSNLNVVADGTQALAFLRKEGEYSHAPVPDLIILGSGVDKPGMLELIDYLRSEPLLQRIPLVVLASSPRTLDVLRDHHVQVNLTITRPEDLSQFEDLVLSIQGICLTVVDTPP